MDDNSGNAPFRRLTRKEEDELFSAIIAGYLKDRIDIEIYPKGISIKEAGNPAGREIFFSFDDDEDETPGYEEE